MEDLPQHGDSREVISRGVPVALGDTPLSPKGLTAQRAGGQLRGCSVYDSAI